MSWLVDDEDDGDYAEYDDSAARVRPNPKGNKPRSKNRPEHADAVSGRVFSVDRGRYGVWVDENTPEERQLVAAKARELGKSEGLQEPLRAPATPPLQSPHAEKEANRRGQPRPNRANPAPHDAASPQRR